MEKIITEKANKLRKTYEFLMTFPKEDLANYIAVACILYDEKNDEAEKLKTLLSNFISDGEQ